MRQHTRSRNCKKICPVSENSDFQIRGTIIYLSFYSIHRFCRHKHSLGVHLCRHLFLCSFDRLFTRIFPARRRDSFRVCRSSHTFHPAEGSALSRLSASWISRIWRISFIMEASSTGKRISTRLSRFLRHPVRATHVHHLPGRCSGSRRFRACSRKLPTRERTPDVLADHRECPLRSVQMPADDQLDSVPRLRKLHRAAAMTSLVAEGVHLRNDTRRLCPVSHCPVSLPIRLQELIPQPERRQCSACSMDIGSE